MAFWLEDSKPLPNGRIQASFGMDSLADVPDLPPLSDRCAEGSDAFSALEKRLVILNADGDWV